MGLFWLTSFPGAALGGIFNGAILQLFAKKIEDHHHGVTSYEYKGYVVFGTITICAAFAMAAIIDYVDRSAKERRNSEDITRQRESSSQGVPQIN